MLQEQLTAKEFFHQLNKDTMHLVDEFYDKDALFQDPIVELNSAASIKKYYGNMYKNVDEIQFTFTDEIIDRSKTTLAWKMILKAKNFNNNEPVVVDGVSIIRFGGKEGKAIYHRDYFDMGAFVYEGLPVIGRIIRFAKSRMAKHQE